MIFSAIVLKMGEKKKNLPVFKERFTVLFFIHSLFFAWRFKGFREQTCNADMHYIVLCFHFKIFTLLNVFYTFFFPSVFPFPCYSEI